MDLKKMIAKKGTKILFEQYLKYDLLRNKKIKLYIYYKLAT